MFTQKVKQVIDDLEYKDYDASVIVKSENDAKNEGRMIIGIGYDSNDNVVIETTKPYKSIE